MRLDLVVKLKYQSSTLMLSIGHKHSMRDLLCDSLTVLDPQSSDMLHTVNDVSALSGTSLP